MRDMLGRPLEEALSSLPPGAPRPRVVVTAAPNREGKTRQDGTLRLICRRGDTWIAARFLDRTPRGKEEA